jgi:hypothetical protein
MFVLIAGTPAVAHAEAMRGSDITISAESVKVWPGGCKSSLLSLSVPGGYEDWAAEAVVVDPWGDEVAWPSFQPGDTRDRTLLCAGLDRRGRYTVDVDWTAYDSAGDVVASSVVTTGFTFQVRPKQATRLRVVTRHPRHGFWTITGRLFKAGSPWARRAVTIEARVEGSWYDLKTKRTDRRGRVRFTAQPSRGARRFALRLHVDGTDRTRPASSRRFRIYP